jgi:1-deoxy-D-xylulose-5-phosphate reductoisomerase
VLNAANEVAVERFLAGSIGFTEIAGLIEAVLTRCTHGPLENLDDVLEADRAARDCAEQCLARLAERPRGNAARAWSYSSPDTRITGARP